MIQPTVGRVVWFRPNGAFLLNFSEYGASQPCAAQIAYVWNERMVNLIVTDHAGVQHAITSVPLVQSDAERPAERSGSYYCEWMPYQMGQAAKTEAALREASKLVPIGGDPLAHASGTCTDQITQNALGTARS